MPKNPARRSPPLPPPLPLPTPLLKRLQTCRHATVVSVPAGPGVRMERSRRVCSQCLHPHLAAMSERWCTSHIAAASPPCRPSSSPAGAFEPLENEGLPQFTQGLYIVNSLAGEAAGSQFLNTILVRGGGETAGADPSLHI